MTVVHFYTELTVDIEPYKRTLFRDHCRGYGGVGSVIRVRNLYNMM